MALGTTLWRRETGPRDRLSEAKRKIRKTNYTPEELALLAFRRAGLGNGPNFSPFWPPFSAGFDWLRCFASKSELTTLIACPFNRQVDARRQLPQAARDLALPFLDHFHRKIKRQGEDVGV